MRHAWHVLTDAFRGWGAHKGSRLAAALAFYAIFSLGPLLLLVIALVALSFGHSEAQTQVHTQLQSVMGSQGAAFVDRIVAETAKRESGSHVAVIAGGALVFLSAAGLFLALQDALDEIWEVPPERKRGFLHTLVLRLHALIAVAALALVALGALIAVNVLASVVHSAVGAGAEPVLQAASIAVNVVALAAFLAVTYRVLPQEKVSWRAAIVGSLISTAILVAGEAGLSIYFHRTHPGAVYGAAGALVIILLWIYYSAQLLLFGAELTRAVEGLGQVRPPQRETVKPS